MVLTPCVTEYCVERQAWSAVVTGTRLQDLECREADIRSHPPKRVDEVMFKGVSKDGTDRRWDLGQWRYFP